VEEEVLPEALTLIGLVRHQQEMVVDLEVPEVEEDLQDTIIRIGQTGDRQPQLVAVLELQDKEIQVDHLLGVTLCNGQALRLEEEVEVTVLEAIMDMDQREHIHHSQDL
jgi:hypothetical protein